MEKNNQMELRSRRSRSKTPLITQQEFLTQETTTGGNHIEETIIRSTRRTIYTTNENTISSTDSAIINSSQNDNLKQQSSSKVSRHSTTKAEKSLRNKLLKTSDYSSEEADNEVSSSRINIQNDRNEMIEEFRSLVNRSSETPALDLYKKSGRYWDVYPKTDWTYSQHSKDRIEIAPGVVAMPNMSRKTIHALDDTSQSNSFETMENFYGENVSHKNINTETTFAMKKTEGARRNLFDNTEEYQIRRRQHTRWTSSKTIMAKIFTFFSTIFYYFHYIQTSIFSTLHWIVGKVMLFDTYLLWKMNAGNKTNKLILLCLIPLILLSGLWFLSGLNGLIHGLISNYTSTSITAFESNYLNNIFWKREFLTPTSDSNNKKLNYDSSTTIIKETLNLTEFDNNEFITNIAHAILTNPSFKNIINNKYKIENIKNILQTSNNNNNNNNNNEQNLEEIEKQQIIINNILTDIEKIKEQIVHTHKINSDELSKLALNMNKCCNKNPVIDIENYVRKIVSDLINNPEFLQNQQGLNSWLHSLFVAKQDLEYHLGNITEKMDVKISKLINSNSHIIMDKVTKYLTEFNRKQIDLTSNRDGGDIEPFPLLSHEEIKKIVKNTLAIYDADKTGLVDYAMETMGGQIVTTRCTETYSTGKAVISILGIPLWHPVNSPRTIIRPSTAPGECWAFQNFPGFVVIKLSSKIHVEAFSMEHISPLLVPDNRIDSAPKLFEVFGLKEENDRYPILLGSYYFNYNGDPLQMFFTDVGELENIFDMIELRILSNHGNPNYTCLYRFRVHGQLYHEQKYENQNR